MKNLKLILMLLFFSISFSGFSQKVKLKNGEVLVDGKVWAQYKESGLLDYSIYINDNEIIFIKFVVNGSDNMFYNSNNYFSVRFVGKQKGFEINKTEPKEIIKILFNSKVLNEDGSLNDTSINSLVDKYGNDISPRFTK
jgi:hypothetical protein